jgi:HlyD family secretion protein
LDDQLQRSVVLNPYKGTLLTKYAQAGEVTYSGKALYKIANLDVLRLKAYFSGDQMASIKLGQTVKIQVDGWQRWFSKLMMVR